MISNFKQMLSDQRFRSSHESLAGLKISLHLTRGQIWGAEIGRGDLTGVADPRQVPQRPGGSSFGATF
jgi:hypothetical protein